MYKDLKKPTTFSQQLAILESRNVMISDREHCEHFLSKVNYYRFSGYFLPFKIEKGSPNYRPVSFTEVEGIYNFDNELRSLLFSVIETIEIYLRTQLSYYCAHKYGSEGYMDAAIYNSKHNHDRFLELINNAVADNSKAPAIKHHVEEYDGHFPVWVIIDFFTLGMLSHFYTDMKNPDKSAIAASLYSVNYQVLSSWLKCLTDLRNRCAHYSRLYYWKFSAMPRIPKGSAFNADRRLFTQIYMLKHLYPDSNDWNSGFIDSLSTLLSKYKSCIQRNHIGFPSNWESILKK